jgi:hypothetical protein
LIADPGHGRGGEEVADLADGGPAQEPAYVVLGERREVADGHAGHREDAEDRGPPQLSRQDGDQAGDRDERPDLGDGGEEGSGGHRCALGGVGDPEVAGDGTGLEEQAHQHQDPAGGYGRSWSVG